MKPLPFSLTGFTMALLLATNLVAAKESINIEPLDEDFLEFIANISEVDGELVDTLDMMDIADNDMNSKNTLEDDFNSEILLHENRGLPKINSSVEENKL